MRTAPIHVRRVIDTCALPTFESGRMSARSADSEPKNWPEALIEGGEPVDITRTERPRFCGACGANACQALNTRAASDHGHVM